MGKKYKVIYERPACIGAAVCVAVDAKHWVLVDDGKADFIGSKELEKNTTYELIIDEADFENMKLAAEGCPVNVIHIIDLETGEKLI